MITTVDAIVRTGVVSAEAGGLLAADRDLFSEVGSSGELSVIKEGADADYDNDESSDYDDEFGADASSDGNGSGSDDNDEENTNHEEDVGDDLTNKR